MFLKKTRKSVEYADDESDLAPPTESDDVKLSRLTCVKVERITSQMSNSGLDPSSDSIPSDVERWLSKHGKHVPKKLNKNQKGDIKEAFSHLDTDGSGAISLDEMVEAFEYMRIPVSHEELMSFIREIDTDGSGEVDYE
eukprot:76055-Pyramimonas_sp.AAC.1